MPGTGRDHWSNEELAAALASIGAALWSYEPRNEDIRWSKEASGLFGLPPGVAPSDWSDLMDRIHPEDRQLLESTVAEAVTQASRGDGEAPLYLEHRIVRSDGAVAWIECHGRLWVDEAGGIRRMLGTIVDITPRRNAEESLRASELQYRLFTEMASDYVYVAEVETMHPEIVAGSFERTTGLTLEEMVQRGGWFQVIHPNDRAAVVQSVPELYSGRTVINEYRIIGPAGEVRWLRDAVRPLFEEGSLVRIMGGVQDITERRRLSEQLLHAGKLDAVARLAGGIAHDFNNMLSVMFTGLDFLRSTLDPMPDDAQSTFEDLANVTQRAAELTRGLLAFSRKQHTRPRNVRVWDVLRSVLPIVTRLMTERIRVDLELVPEEPVVRIDPGQLELTMINLASNARDAMPRGGTLTIRGSVADLGENDPLRPAELRPGRHVQIDVQDTGSGMAPEVLEHAFEPFFTTKRSGQGTGLGLATSHGTIRQAEGAITVESEVGVGTCVRILLPVTQGEATRLDEAEDPQAPTRGQERLLIVEDEPAVRRQTVRLLQELGYEVYSAASAEDALGLPEGLLDQVELLVSDVVLPGMSGIELAQRFQEQRKRPVVLMSGYIGDEIEALAARSHYRVLAKPFTPRALAVWVRSALDLSSD